MPTMVICCGTTSNDSTDVMDSKANVLKDAFTCRNCGVEIEVVSPSIVPSGSFSELKSHCHLYGAQGQRQAYYAHATMISWVDYVRQAQWSSRSESRFHTTSPGSIPGLDKVDLDLHPFCSESINEYQACLGA
ncbi:hypothetical protein TNCV_2390661 [Trichonephila clavipes]|nr:hypothetical protein TNCV_2390661 [Trichonephila clavipes]